MIGARVPYYNGVPRRIVLVVNCFELLKLLLFFYFAICDLVHDVKATY